VILGKVFSPLESAGPLLVRVALGVVFLYHGGDKLGILGPDGFDASIQRAIGAAEHVGFAPAAFWGWALALTEFGGGLLLLVGFATRYAAFALAFVMLIAAWRVHGSSGFSLERGGFEYAGTLMMCCLSLLLTGAGSLSVDGWLAGDAES